MDTAKKNAAAAAAKTAEAEAAKAGVAADAENGVKDFKKDICNELNKIMKMYKAGDGNKGKVMGYQRAISQIRAYGGPITSADQLKGIPWVGKAFIDKIS